MDKRPKEIKILMETMKDITLFKPSMSVDYNYEFDLNAKRKEFQTKMELLEEKRRVVCEKQKDLDERVASFESYLLENKIKRHRSAKLLEQENKLIESLKRKNKEYENNITELKHRHTVLSELLKSHMKYEEFFNNVLKTLPKEYVKLTDNPIQGLMTRYDNLIQSGRSVLQSLFDLAEQTEVLTKQFNEYVNNAKLEIMTLNYEITESQRKRFELDNKLSLQEEKVQIKTQQVRSQLEFFGIVLRAIDNITEKCLKRSPTSQVEKGSMFHVVKNMLPEEKFEVITNYILDAKDMVRRVEAIRQQNNDAVIPPITTKEQNENKPVAPTNNNM